MQFNDAVVQWGADSDFVANSKDPYASWRMIRVEGESSTSTDTYSPMKNGIFFPTYRSHKEVWDAVAKQSGTVAQEGIYWADQIAKESENTGYVLSKTFKTQTIEPMMMEPEAANAWFDPSSKTFHVIISSQSPQDMYQQGTQMLADSKFKTLIDNFVVHAPLVGGGFGAKDHSIFPYYGLLAGLYASAPVRLANDRFEQFQAGLKRHPFTMKNKLAIDPDTKKIQSLISDMDLDGGGRVNFSPSVAMVGATAIQGIYYLPKNDLQATAYPSRDPDHGSMRGYGTIQAMAAMEMMINEAANDLKVDPIELRKINAQRSGDKNSQGAIPNGTSRYVEMLQIAEKDPIWVNRKTAKTKFDAENPDKSYGVGFSMVTKDYGTGANAPVAYVNLEPDGKIKLTVGYVEMGTGTMTAQAVIVAKNMGRPSDEIITSEIDAWQTLQLEETDSPYIISQDRQDKMSKNPRWTPVETMASSASASAYFQSFATELATKIVYTNGLWPAAVNLWKTKYFNSQYAAISFEEPDRARWVDGKLNYQGFPPLSLEELSGEAHRLGLVTGAMIHTFNRWAWAEGEWEILGQRFNLAADAIALRYGTGATNQQKALLDNDGFHLLDRRSINYPKTALNNAGVTYYTPCATVVELAVHKGSGEVQLLSTHSWLECGNPIVKELVEGQMEGGIAMGIGHTLHEYLPLYEDGPGNGTWNLNRYKVPLAKDIAVWNQKHTILKPLSVEDPPKGCSEVVCIPVVAAIIEAIYQATGKRFYHLPVTPKDIKGEAQ